MNYFRFKLQRIKPFGPSDFAIIDVEALDEKIESTDQVMERICNAIADWVENTKEGKELWEENDGEVTVADIADVADMLNVQLAKQGLKNLGITLDHDMQADPTQFTLDSNLPVRAEKFTDPSDILN